MEENRKSAAAQSGASFTTRWLRASGFSLLCVFFLSCSLMPRIPVTKDERIERLVRSQAEEILAVTGDASNTSKYQIFLSDFPRADILGMSIGNRRIYINYKLATRAFKSRRYLWLLRQTLAHEIAHEVAGHAEQTRMSFSRASIRAAMTGGDLGLPWYVTFQPYSLEKELQADLQGLTFWQRLQWNCVIWVEILEDFERQNYSGDLSHPTDARLEQATRACRSRSKTDKKQPDAIDKPLSVRFITD